jgi:ATP-dependent DNA helicase 2 subunit 2
MSCGNGETEYKEKQISRLVKMIKQVGVKINFIAIDFMDEYSIEMDDPERSE